MESAENREQPISGNESEEDKDLSLSKIETIALLNDSIDRLEQTIKGISESSAPMPSSDSINTLLTTTQELADAVIPSSTISSASATDEASPTTAKTESEIAKTAVSPQIKTTEAESRKQPSVTKIQKKQNLPLIVIGVTAIAIFVVALFWLWLPRQQATLSSSPELTPDVASNVEALSDQETLRTPSIDNQAPSDNITLTDLPAATAPLNSEPENSAEILIPDNLESPGRPQNLKIVTIEPELDFTPEQTLIAALKTKVTKLTQDYPAELIDSVKVDLSQNRLLVNVTDEWYGLSESRQSKMANEMLKRSRQFSFHKLELKDNVGTLVARNPVIGDQIIILQNNKQ